MHLVDAPVACSARNSLLLLGLMDFDTFFEPRLSLACGHPKGCPFLLHDH